MDNTIKPTTHRRKKFARALVKYSQTMNFNEAARLAAIDAGFSDGPGLRNTINRLVQNSAVLGILKKSGAFNFEIDGFKLSRMMAEIYGICTADMADFLDESGNIDPVKIADNGNLIKAITYGVDDNGNRYITKLELWPKMQAVNKFIDFAKFVSLALSRMGEETLDLVSPHEEQRAVSLVQINTEIINNL